MKKNKPYSMRSIYMICLSLFSFAGQAENTPTPAAPATPTAAQPVTVTPVQPSTIPTPQPAPTINCNYRIPASTTTIALSIIQTWAEKATQQAFDYNPATIDEQLAALKACFTEQGWQGYNDALQKSGNITAIKSQHLNVSSQITGKTNITAIKDNQWKVSLPLQVVYQNDKEKLTQLLTIDLLVGRKVSGDLGIMQIIAAPRPTTTIAPQTPATVQKP